MVERVLRGLAIVIAVLALIDPAVQGAGRARQTVVVLPAPSGPAAAVGQVAAALGSAYAVSTTEVPSPAAYVLTGADVPGDWMPPPDAVVFAVTPSVSSTDLQLARLAAPKSVPVDSVARIDVEALVSGSGDRDVTFTLVVDGARLQTATGHVTGDESRAAASLTFVPVAPGLVHLRVLADAPGRRTAAADAGVMVTARAWRILAFDERPSFASTFVRRALESDPRFAVTTRIATSRQSAIETNAPPASVSHAGDLDPFDVVVIGAADMAGAEEAEALREYLRNRHGAVVLLPERPAGALLPRLTGEASWQEDRRADALSVTAATGSWSAREFIWPAAWPALTAPLATLDSAAADSGARYPVWQAPVGGGRLVVSSAVDGWRSRTGSSLGFSLFWRSTIAALAEATPPGVLVATDARLVRPAQPVEVTVELLSSSEPVARLRDAAGNGVEVRLWPSGPALAGAPRILTGGFRAPDRPGRYRVEVTTGTDATGDSEFLVIDEAALGGIPLHALAARNGLAAAAASAHRGQVVPAAALDTLAARIAEAAAPPAARQRVYPMQSLWWLLPFTLCVSGEWWLRRRRGLR